MQDVSFEVDSVLRVRITNPSPDHLPLVNHVEAENVKRFPFTLRRKISDRNSDERTSSLAVQASTPLIHPRALLRDSREIKCNPLITFKRDGTLQSARKSIRGIGAVLIRVSNNPTKPEPSQLYKSTRHCFGETSSRQTNACEWPQNFTLNCVPREGKAGY